MITHAASRKHYYTVLLDRTLGAVFFCVDVGKNKKSLFLLTFVLTETKAML